MIEFNLESPKEGMRYEKGRRTRRGAISWKSRPNGFARCIAASGLAGIRAARADNGAFYPHFESKRSLCRKRDDGYGRAVKLLREIGSAGGLEAVIAAYYRRSTGTTPEKAARWPLSCPSWRATC